MSHQADRNSDLVEVIKRNGDCGTVCRCYHLRAHCCTLSNEKLSQDGSGTLIGRVGTLRVPSFRTRNFTNAGSRNTCKSRTLATKSVADIGSPLCTTSSNHGLSEIELGVGIQSAVVAFINF